MMRSRSELPDRLLACLETAPESGAFELDERLRVEEVWQRCDGRISSARISVRLDDAFDSEEARRRYDPERRIVVTTDQAVADEREVLFEGYPPRQTWRWDGRVRGECEEYVFDAEHVLERLTRAPEAMVYGRQVRTGAIEDGLVSLPAEYADKSFRMTALPCVFNPEGVANCAAAPLSITLRPGGQRTVDIFTWDGDSTARKWTYGTALRYLVWFHLQKPGPVSEGNVFAASDWLAAGRKSPGGALAEALAVEPASLSCEGTSLVEALALLAAAAGIHITAETVNTGSSVATRLRVWAADDGACRQLYLARGGRYPDGRPYYSIAGQTAAAVLADNNTYRGKVSWFGHEGRVEAVVLGAVKRYEMTLPLWPGWLPEVNLDNVAEVDRPAAKALALTPAMVEALGPAAPEDAWFRCYHREGVDFAAYANVARLWVLNEDGSCAAELYDRNAPFDDYRPFDFSSVADVTVTTPGAWMRRGRRLLAAISRPEDCRGSVVWVEISFDGGLSWQRQSSGVRILEDCVGLYFECDNPTEIRPGGADPSVQNLWYALVDQTMRVRVTGVIESDERLIGRTTPTAGGVVQRQVNALVVRRMNAFRLVSREHTTDVLANAGTLAPEQRNDSEAIARLAETLARTAHGRRVKALPAIPWLEMGYAIGDRITEVRGRQVRLATARDGDPRWPAVLERKFVLCEGCYETVLTVEN